MPFVRFADPFAPQTQRRCGPTAAAQGQGHCGRRQQQQQNPILDFFSALEKELSGPAAADTPQPKKSITPSFDVIETDTSYVLQGNLPGVSDKKSLDIEFIDAQTLVIKGEIARRQIAKPTTSASSAGVNAVTEKQTEQPQQDATEEPLPVYSETSSSTDSSDTASTHSHQPTVEETADESDNEFDFVESPSTLKASSSPTPADVTKPTQSTEEASEPSEKQVESTPATAAPTQTAPQQQEQQKQKFWLSERAVGVFERVFKFEHLINQEAVTASLEHGVLEIVVPKREKYVRRVVIQ